MLPASSVQFRRIPARISTSMSVESIKKILEANPDLQNEVNGAIHCIFKAAYVLSIPATHVLPFLAKMVSEKQSRIL